MDDYFDKIKERINKVTKILPGNIVKIGQNKNGDYNIKNQSYYVLVMIFQLLKTQQIIKK